MTDRTREALRETWVCCLLAVVVSMGGVCAVELLRRWL